MPDRRQAFRREPIEIELDESRVISVGPLPWQDRNLLGDEIIRQHTEALNEAVRLFVAEDGETPQIQARLGNKLSDPLTVLVRALSDADYRIITSQDLYMSQITEILLASLEVNELLHLRPLVDPNFEAPAGIGGMISLLTQNEEEDTPKIESGLSSSSGDSIDQTSLLSPTQS